jgi:hypothetical protein
MLATYDEVLTAIVEALDSAATAASKRPAA